MRLFVAVWLALCIVVVTSAGMARADAPRRVALIIANADYVNGRPLKNPVNDSALIAAALKKAGFQVVDVEANLGTGAFNHALRAFGEQAAGADAAVIYYAGHGIEAQGTNWLLPVDVTLTAPRDLDYEAISIDKVLAATEGARMRMVVLDACRDNPFAKSRSWSGATRGGGEGGLDEVKADDVLVIYSAAPGAKALDGSGTYSPFAQALARRLPEAGMEIHLLGSKVRDDVLRMTGEQQRPYVSLSISGDAFFFVGGGGAVDVTPSPAQRGASEPAFDVREADLALWTSVGSSNDVAQLSAYLSQFPNGIFAGAARAKLAALFATRTPPSAAVATQADPRGDINGQAAAPGLIAAGGLDCRVDGARLIGQAVDAQTHLTRSFYELSCKGNEGLVVIKSGDQVTAYSCVQANKPQADGRPSAVSCQLPGNADPKAGLIPYIAKAGVNCDPTNIRAIGQSPTSAVFELVCSNNPGGFILETSAPPRLDKPAKANPCVMFPDSANVRCELTDRATQLTVVDKLSAASGKPCAIKEGGRGFLGAAQSGKIYYEEACEDGKGFILVQEANGAFAEAIACAEADSVSGGCKLTDSRQAKTEQAGLYTRLAKKVGYNCDVAGYAPLPGSRELPNHEVVELKCANRPDGAIAFFPASASEKGAAYDCAHSELLGYRCSLTKAAAAYASLSEDLRKVGKTTCAVSAAREVGVTADKKGFIEVGCSDGLQGYMLEYGVAPPAALEATTTILCAQAGGIAGGCTLPGNTKKS